MWNTLPTLDGRPQSVGNRFIRIRIWYLIYQPLEYASLFNIPGITNQNVKNKQNTVKYLPVMLSIMPIHHITLDKLLKTLQMPGMFKQFDVLNLLDILLIAYSFVVKMLH